MIKQKNIKHGLLALTIIIIVCGSIHIFNRWVYKPFVLWNDCVSNVEDWMIQDDIEEIKESKEIYNNNYDGILPSESYHDYRDVAISTMMDCRSFFKMNSAKIVIEEITSPEKNRIIKMYDGEFIDPDRIPDNFCEKNIYGHGFIIYVGDCKSEEEIQEIITSLVKSCKFKMYYNMQWFGNREYTGSFEKENSFEVRYADFTDD